VASLLHDDVLDDAETRRGILSLNAQAGNKLAILAGDFLLARASVTLASLHNTGASCVCSASQAGRNTWCASMCEGEV
jgi:geranylgeranyl pyrophosphate synthase